MATINFLTKGNSDFNSIYVRVRNGKSTDISMSTGIQIESKFWSKAKGEVKTSNLDSTSQIVIDQLEQIKRKIRDYFNENRNVPFTKEKLTEFVNSNHSIENNLSSEDTNRLIVQLNLYKEKLKYKTNPRTGKAIAPGTIKNFSTTKKRLELYEKHLNSTILLEHVDLDFQDQYSRFMKDELQLSQNSMSKDFKQIKTILSDAQDRGLQIHVQGMSRKFNLPQEKTIFVTITEDELIAINQFKGADYLENARDWLIIGCWTGCRVNDLMNLTMTNIQLNKDNKTFIRYTQSKTSTQVDLAIHPDVALILEKRNGFPRPISDQKFNKWIKIVAEKSGLTNIVHGDRQNPLTHRKETGFFKKHELIKSHTCRRSFATNLFNKLPNKVIMAATGHTTEKMLLNYIGETENTHLDVFIDLWK